MNPHYEEVLSELRQLRGSAGLFSVDKMAASPVLISLLGGGDVYDAYSSLRGYLNDATSRERFVAAAAASIMGAAETSLDRLTMVGEQYVIDQRTVRRWSDKGLESIAADIASNGWMHTQPVIFRALLTGLNNDGLLRVALSMTAPDSQEFKPPLIHLNDVVAFEDYDYELTRHPERDDYYEMMRVLLIELPSDADEVTLNVIVNSLKIPDIYLAGGVGTPSWRAGWAVNRQSLSLYVTRQ